MQVMAIITKKTEGQKTIRRVFKGKASEVEKKVYDVVRDYPFWDTTIKWLFNKKR